MTMSPLICVVMTVISIMSVISVISVIISVISVIWSTGVLERVFLRRADVCVLGAC